MAAKWRLATQPTFSMGQWTATLCRSRVVILSHRGLSRGHFKRKELHDRRFSVNSLGDCKLLH
jgi:hypothetical protein